MDLIWKLTKKVRSKFYGDTGSAMVVLVSSGGGKWWWWVEMVMVVGGDGGGVIEEGFFDLWVRKGEEG